jgi:hypothetical protein
MYYDELDRRCAAHVNVDSTGGIGATVLSDNGVVSELAPLAKEVTLAETGQHHEGKRFSRSSDQSFWGIGIPSMYGSISHQPPSPVKMRNALGWWWHTPHDLLDKIDEEFLTRDTRIVVSTLWRLLTDEVVPLDHAAHASSLLAELNALAPKLEGALPLSDLLDTAEELKKKAKAFAGMKLKGGRKKLDAIDAASMAFSRALLPLDYTEGDRFIHDAALPQPAWPALQKLRDLAKARQGSDEERFLAVAARRARNRLAHHMHLAIEALDAGLAAAKPKKK